MVPFPWSVDTSISMPTSGQAFVLAQRRTSSSRVCSLYPLLWAAYLLECTKPCVQLCKCPHTLYFEPRVFSTVSLQPPECIQDITFCFSAFFWGGRGTGHQTQGLTCLPSSPSLVFILSAHVREACIGPCPMTPGGRYYYQPYFPDKETEAREVRLPACSGSKAKIPFQFGSGTGSYALTHTHSHVYVCFKASTL